MWALASGLGIRLELAGALFAAPAATGGRARRG